MGGLAGADALCNAHAAAAGLTQKFAAFLSVPGMREVNGLLTGVEATALEVKNIKGEKLYDDWSSIFSGTNPSMANPMYTFSGTEVTNSFCADADGWTGSTLTGGASSQNCSGWTSVGGSGIATEIDGKEMLRQESHNCTDVLAVMCVSVSQ
jgi:hypothetical protein